MLRLFYLEVMFMDKQYIEGTNRRTSLNYMDHTAFKLELLYFKVYRRTRLSYMIHTSLKLEFQPIERIKPQLHGS